MAEYNDQSGSSLSFDLTRDNKPVGKLTYKNWFSFKATVELANNSVYQIEPKSFWGRVL